MVPFQIHSCSLQMFASFAFFLKAIKHNFSILSLIVLIPENCGLASTPSPIPLSFLVAHFPRVHFVLFYCELLIFWNLAENIL